MFMIFDFSCTHFLLTIMYHNTEGKCLFALGNNPVQHHQNDPLNTRVV